MNDFEQMGFYMVCAERIKTLGPELSNEPMQTWDVKEIGA
jgi:hypothetical protein